MKILVVASFPDSLVSFRGALLDAMLAKGIEVHAAAPDLPLGGAVRQHLESRGVVVHEISMHRTGVNPVADVSTLLALCCLMRRIKPSHVLAYTIKPVIYGMLAARLTGVPYRFALITGLGYAFTGEARGLRAVLRAIIGRLYGLALCGTDKVFFQNPDDRTFFKELGILRPDTPTTVVNGSGVDVSAYSVTPLPAAPQFLLIARLLGDKGVREYAEAAKRLRSRHPEAQCRLVGWIDANPDAIRLEELDAWIAQGSIEYLGRLNDVRPAIANCSVYVLPSYREGTPRTVLEAMSMGRAIITTNAPGCRETVVDGDNGYLVPVQSVDALLEAMQRFMDDPALASRMGKRSRAIAEEKYDVNKVNAVMLNEMGLL